MTDQTVPAIGTRFPLLFTFRETLFGTGFLVEVCASNGRVLCSHEEDGVWMYGVNPGGMSAFGEDANAARREFRATFSRVLKELAQETRSFEEFRAVVANFFHDTNAGNEERWNKGVEQVRAGNVQASDMIVAPAESPRNVTIELKAVPQVRPSDNEAELKLARAA